MKTILFCITVLAMATPLFAEGVEIHSKTAIPVDSEAGTPPIRPSRSVTLKAGQYLDIAYPGAGWVYLGETEGSSLLKYEKRELGDGDTFFTLLAGTAGTATLHFYKSDALTGSYIDDYLTVIISGTSRDREHVEAPSYADLVPPRPSFTKSSVVAQALQDQEQKTPADDSRRQTALPQGNGGTGTSTITAAVESGDSEDDRSATVIQTSSPNSSQAVPAGAVSGGNSRTDTAVDGGSKQEDTANMSESEVLALARKAYEARDYEASLSYLTDFFDRAVSLTDEGLFLKGQILEAPSASRNIKEALASYRAIISNYPESELWNDAEKRISYIERIYFDIR